jgi:hypothetical protein
MMTERPLASLPAEQAALFIRALFAPNQRFARAFHHYWRVVLQQNEATAKLNTHIELAQACASLIANLGDPAIHVVCHDDQPIGIFGYRELRAHAFGEKIADVVAAGSLAETCKGPLGIAHCVGILDEHASIDVLKRIFASLARKATAAGHQQLFFFTSDHRLEGLYRRFGMEFPAELALPDSKHLVGMFDLARCENRIRLSHLEAALDKADIELPRAA